MFVVCSVLDKRAVVFGGLYLAPNVEVAARYFGDAVRSGSDSVVRSHPEDFCLVQVGSFDELTGELVGFSEGKTEDKYRVIVEAIVLTRETQMIAESFPTYGEYEKGRLKNVP